jgi:hypothetical protein
VSPGLREAFERELAAASEQEAAHAFRAAWKSLERAHVLSQAFAGAHLRVHWRMFRFAWRRRDPSEVAGQIPRLLLAAPGSWTGRAPQGNTGGADVGIFTPMAVTPDLAEILERFGKR